MYPFLPDDDIDGDPRPLGAGLEMGADEVAPPGDPVPDLTGNDSDGPLFLRRGQLLSVKLALEAGNRRNEGADWWILLQTPFPSPLNWFHYDFGTSWHFGFGISQMAPCQDYGPQELLRTPGLPPGKYTFYFLLDMDMDGRLDFGELYYDILTVTITR